MSKRRSLWPREHGAYAQLAAPVVTVLLLRLPSVPAVLLAVAAFAAFLANEPLLVVLGHRGARRQTSDGPRAKRRLAVLGVISCAAAATGLSLAGIQTLQLATVVALPVGALLVLAWRRGQHSLAGELVAALALPAASAPIAVASGIEPRVAVLVWIAWSVGYAASVLAVHRVIARHRSQATRFDHILGLALGGVLLASIALGASHPVLLVAAPLVAISTVVVVRPPRASYLRAIGVALVVGSLASLGIAVWAA